MRLCLFFLLTLSLVACRPPAEEAAGDAGAISSEGAPPATEGLQGRVETESEPQLGEVPVLVYLLENGEGVSGAEIEITGDMTHAGMVPVIVSATETEPGIYRADDFEFTMAGDWIISADVELADGTKQQLETTLSVPGR